MINGNDFVFLSLSFQDAPVELRDDLDVPFTSHDAVVSETRRGLNGKSNRRVQSFAFDLVVLDRRNYNRSLLRWFPPANLHVHRM